MLVLVIRKFDQISTENKVTVPGTTYPHHKSMGKLFIAQGRVTLKRIIQPGPNSNLSQDFMPLLDTCKFEEVVFKT